MAIEVNPLEALELWREVHAAKDDESGMLTEMLVAGGRLDGINNTQAAGYLASFYLLVSELLEEVELMTGEESQTVLDRLRDRFLAREEEPPE